MNDNPGIKELTQNALKMTAEQILFFHESQFEFKGLNLY